MNQTNQLKEKIRKLTLTFEPQKFERFSYNLKPKEVKYSVKPLPTISKQRQHKNVLSKTLIGKCEQVFVDKQLTNIVC